MARNKNSTRKKNRKRNRKTYRKIANRNMRGGMSSLFSSLTYNLKKSFSIFGSNAKEQATNAINEKKAEAGAKIAEARGYVNKKTECLAACAKL